MPTDEKICIVDDDAIAIFGIKRALMTINCTREILIFENGLDALDAFKQKLAEGRKIPSPVFIDLNMPVLDGWELVRQINMIIPSKKEMPVIYIMTSSIDTRDMEKAKIFGLENHYLIKPVTAEHMERVFSI